MIRPSHMTNRELYRALMELSASLTCVNIQRRQDFLDAHEPGEQYDNEDHCGYETCKVRQMEELADEIASRLEPKGATIV